VIVSDLCPEMFVQRLYIISAQGLAEIIPGQRLYIISAQGLAEIIYNLCPGISRDYI
jgi:hypothetical protein